MLFEDLWVAVGEPQQVESLRDEVAVGEDKAGVGGDEAVVGEGGQVEEDSRIDSTSNQGDGGGGGSGV